MQCRFQLHSLTGSLWLKLCTIPQSSLTQLRSLHLCRNFSRILPKRDRPLPEFLTDSAQASLTSAGISHGFCSSVTDLCRNFSRILPKRDRPLQEFLTDSAQASQTSAGISHGFCPSVTDPCRNFSRILLKCHRPLPKISHRFCPSLTDLCRNFSRILPKCHRPLPEFLTDSAQASQTSPEFLTHSAQASQTSAGISHGLCPSVTELYRNFSQILPKLHRPLPKFLKDSAQA